MKKPVIHPASDHATTPGGIAMRRNIEFHSEDTICRGWLYTPGNVTERAPTIVMAHGFSGVKEQRLDRFAEAFAEAGFASVVFDYRGFGESDGELRQDVDAARQVADYRNAISFARTLDVCDPERIGVWGTSFSGANVLMAGAFDRRVKCVVAQVPLLDGWETLGRLSGVEAREAFIEQLIAERERIYRGESPTLIPVVSDGGFAALPTPDAYEWFLESGQEASNWRNEVTFLSLERLIEYAPIRFIDRIAPTPLLLIAASEDFLPLDVAQAAVERAGEPKDLKVLSGGHFTPYEPPLFATAAGWAVEWFKKHLAA